MPKKNYKPEEIVAKLRQADVLIAQGTKIPDVVRTLGVTQVTYYRWRREIGRACRGGSRHHGRRCRFHCGARALAQVRHAPDATLLVIADIERTIGTDRETGRAMRSATRGFLRTRKAIGEDHVFASSLAISHRLEGDCIATLRTGRAIP